VNLLLRGVRIIDPLQRVDEPAMDLRIEAGRLTAMGRGLEPAGLPVIDMTPTAGGGWRVVAPGFIDLHAHLREPGNEDAETVESGARAAAAGGFTQVVAMANTHPPADTPERVAAAVQRSRAAWVSVRTCAALTRGLLGVEPVSIEACAEAGAVAFSDDGRNAVAHATLVEALRRSARMHRAVLVHPEDEAALAASPDQPDIVRRADRPPAVEVAAVDSALSALREAGSGHLHLQHVTTARSVELVAAAKRAGLDVTAEVTPHHLGLWVPADEPAMSDPLLKVNPPLRARDERAALVQAVRGGVIDCIATDHAPHAAADKRLAYPDAAPGMIGLETALGVCVSLGELGGDSLPVLVERLTAGPYRVLRSSALVERPSLRLGAPVSCVLFDPEEEWTVAEDALQSRSRNTPLLGASLRGRVLLTIGSGRVVHRDGRLPVDMLEPAHA
jgi:dihydroorotase